MEVPDNQLAMEKLEILGVFFHAHPAFDIFEHPNEPELRMLKQIACDYVFHYPRRHTLHCYPVDFNKLTVMYAMITLIEKKTDSHFEAHVRAQNALIDRLIKEQDTQATEPEPAPDTQGMKYLLLEALEKEGDEATYVKNALIKSIKF